MIGFDIDPGGKIEALGAAPKDFRKPYLPQLATANEPSINARYMKDVFPEASRLPTVAANYACI
jgi:hypothetical protein